MVADFEKRASLTSVWFVTHLGYPTAVDCETLMESIQVKSWSAE